MESRDTESLLKHMEWADAQTWNAVRCLPKGARDARVLGLLYHLHTVQWVYLQVWRGQPPSVPEAGRFPDLAALADWALPYYAELRAFARGLDADRLSREIALPWAAEIAKRYGSAAPATLSEMVLQVVLHTTYHRAQVATRIRELGGSPGVTDFIAWVWRQRPEPEWNPAPQADPSPGPGPDPARPRARRRGDGRRAAATSSRAAAWRSP
jgi:uncharacterized damage-inducible protein DinB